MRSLGELEREVMDRLWDGDQPMSVRDVLEALTERDLAYTTVMTVLDRLGRKNMVTRVRDGRAYLYTAAAGRDALAAELMRTALEDAGPSRTEALVRFTEHVSPEEAEAMKNALDRIIASND